MIRWEKDPHPRPECRGWCAFIGAKLVGKVYVDGAAWFGARQVRPGSQALAAEALVRHFEVKR